MVPLDRFDLQRHSLYFDGRQAAPCNGLSLPARRISQITGAAMGGQRSVGGWGYDDAAVSDDEAAGLAQLLAARFPGADLSRRAPADWRGVALPAPRLAPPGALGDVCTDEPV